MMVRSLSSGLIYHHHKIKKRYCWISGITFSRTSVDENGEASWLHLDDTPFGFRCRWEFVVVCWYLHLGEGPGCRRYPGHSNSPCPRGSCFPDHTPFLCLYGASEGRNMCLWWEAYGIVDMGLVSSVPLMVRARKFVAMIGFGRRKLDSYWR